MQLFSFSFSFSLDTYSFLPLHLTVALSNLILRNPVRKCLSYLLVKPSQLKVK